MIDSVQQNVFGRITVNDLFIYLFVNLLVIFMVNDTAYKILEDDLDNLEKTIYNKIMLKQLFIKRRQVVSLWSSKDCSCCHAEPLIVRLNAFW